MGEKHEKTKKEEREKRRERRGKGREKGEKRREYGEINEKWRKPGVLMFFPQKTFKFPCFSPLNDIIMGKKNVRGERKKEETCIKKRGYRPYNYFLDY